MKTNYSKTNLLQEMSPKVKLIYDHLINKALGDRSEEWFTTEMFDRVQKTGGYDDKYPIWHSESDNRQSVIIRRALAINHMLLAMTDEANSEKTNTAEILKGDLLLGVLPMGSNGLGKTFPRYLTEDELRAGSVTNRNAASLFGHNSMDYEELLRDGLLRKIEFCSAKLDYLAPLVKKGKEHLNACEVSHEECMADGNLSDEEKDLSFVRLIKETNKIMDIKEQFDFYWAVKLSCQSVIDYANRFADIAEEKANQLSKEEDQEEKKELLELARIARKVPAEPAETFHEAMQSICFFHIALHASMNLISLGRLDQVLNPYLEKEANKNKALDIFECFIIKCAGRINLNPNYLVEQDHVDYATVLGTHAYYIDQKAGTNNFLQNIIVGGKKPDGTDATNSCTYLIIQAFENVNLTTPGIYVRMSKDSPKELVEQVASSLFKTKNNPSILNDDVMIKAMYDALMQNEDPSDKALCCEMMKLANDYCVDGCWEPILNGKSDWTFGMLTGMQAVESALNQGASLKKDEQLFRGAKVSPTTPVPQSFEDVMEYLKIHMQFFVDQSVMSLFKYYKIDENAAPSPLFSAYLDGCMDKGKDKASGGANHNIGGVVIGSVPDMVNQLAAIKRWVYDKKKYELKDVCAAIRENFSDKYEDMRIDFDTNSPKFGDGNAEADELTNTVLDIFLNAVNRAAKFGKEVFQDVVSPKDLRRITSLRSLAGYYGRSLGRSNNIDMKITAGMGTFEQYNWQGRGIAASANRKEGSPIAPNFSPVPGTTHSGVMGVMDSLSKLKLDRFAAGVITDICVNSDIATENMIQNIVTTFIEKRGGMMTLAIGTAEYYDEIYKIVIEARKNPKEAASLLIQYAGVNVRIGGWQSPFITLPFDHMENYINRPQFLKK